MIGFYYTLSWELDRVEDKYEEYVTPISIEIEHLKMSILKCQEYKEKYLEYAYFKQINVYRERFQVVKNKVVDNVYKAILKLIGVKDIDKGMIFSPYLYLQIIYQFQGAPSMSKETMISIDEAQGIAVEEIRLLQNLNSKKTIFNLFGDMRQHIENTKGLDSWTELNDIFEYNQYELVENYRNASQITEYCNKKLDMNMLAINTQGKGVVEIDDENSLVNIFGSILSNSDKRGLSAILVHDFIDLKYFYKIFDEYRNKFHDMTGDNNIIHRSKWNIMKISDAKGLEFSNVMVIASRMTNNEKYIAYTRALDSLYVYDAEYDVSEIVGSGSVNNTVVDESNKSMIITSDKNIVKNNYDNSMVSKFFIDNGLKIVDKRSEGGRLWVLGEKEAIRDVINQAISRFNISGKYVSKNDEINMSGWCTKTDK